MLARTVTIPLSSAGVSQLLALVIEPELNQETAPVLLFLHGQGEAGSTLSSLPLVCVHQTPPFQAILGRLPGTLVIAPQAPPIPNWDDWSWRDYAIGLAEFLADRYAGRHIVATGFSRGGLGVLQLISACPDSVQASAAIDPQPARDRQETEAILSSPTLDARAWVRYGEYRHRRGPWQKFSSKLLDRVPEENRDTAELSHGEMSVQAYGGSALTIHASKKNLYNFLGLNFENAPVA